jgi:hypothetical protein
LGKFNPWHRFQQIEHFWKSETLWNSLWTEDQFSQHNKVPVPWAHVSSNSDHRYSQHLHERLQDSKADTGSKQNSVLSHSVWMSNVFIVFLILGIVYGNSIWLIHIFTSPFQLKVRLQSEIVSTLKFC